jgi:hypothetical protein
LSLDAQILAATLNSRIAYDAIKDHFNAKEASPSIAFWYELVRDYYERDKAAGDVQRDTLRELGARRITNPKHADAILSTLDDLKSVSSPNVVELVLDLRRSNLALEFAAATSNKDHNLASELLTQLNAVWEQTELKEKSDVEYAKEWQDLDSVVGRDGRTPIGPSSLDSRIGGGVLPGHHVLIFGRTEIGKSCLTVSMTANLIRSGKNVLYIGNEDSINILKARVRLSLLGQSQSWVDTHPNKARRLLAELSSDRLTMVHIHPGSISEVEDLTAKHSPNIIILDQIRNLSGAEDGMTQKMEHNAIRFRSLLGRQKIIGISVTQAGDRSQGHNSDGPIYLSAGDVDSSRVGLPGTVDLQIGIGANADMLARGLRMLSFAKNKLATGGKSREPLLVRFNLELNRVEDT